MVEDPRRSSGRPRSIGYRILRLLLILVLFAGVVLTNYLELHGVFRLAMAIAGGLLALINVPALFPEQRDELVRRSRKALSGRRRPAGSPGSPGVERPTPAQLPRPQPGFRGRQAELEALEKAFREFRGRRPGRLDRVRAVLWRLLVRRPAGLVPDAAGRPGGLPIVVVHGMPGVGKTALVTEFAHRIGKEYPAGQLYASLGVGATARPTGEVLEELLTGLGWPQDRMPEDTEGRGRVFRSLTQDMRLLVVLDAVRDGERLYELLPGGPQCAVVVTSRRDFPRLGALSFPLGVPNTEDAVEILHAAVAAHRDRAPAVEKPDDSLVAVVEVVRLCGHLPAALKAVAGQTAPPNGRTLRQVAADLADPDRRLDLLNRDGANVRALFDSEYTALFPNEQKALTYLALLEAETFVPWVLVPLLGGVFGIGEADNLMARLGAAHLVDVADRAGSGAVRYRFHPLVRLFAREVAQPPVGPFERLAALVRVDGAYRGVAAEILRLLGTRMAGAEPPGRWLPPAEVLEAIARAPDRWARREQQHLVRCIDSATEQWELRWQVAARLGAFVPRGVDAGRTVAALDAVLAAAAERDAWEAALRVGLARASLLIALERYAEAEAGIERVVAGATEAGLADLVTTARRRQAEGLLQMGAYDATRHHLDMADEAAQASGVVDEWEARRIAQLRVVCRTHREPEHWRDGLVEEAAKGDDSGSFYRVLADSEHARRAGDFDTADRLLLDLYREHRVDLRRCATVEYWRGRLWLTRARLAAAERAAGFAERAAGFAERAAGYAAEALLSFREMANRLGEARAGCLLVRALGNAGRPAEAREQARLATELLAELPASTAVRLIQARLYRARAELLLHGATSRTQRRPGWTARAEADARRDLADEASKLLTPALAVFKEHHDWWSIAECGLLLGRANRLAGRPAIAVGLLYTAADAFNRARDEVHQTLALREMHEAARAMRRGGPPRPQPQPS